MAPIPHIAESACKHGVNSLDVYSVLKFPLLVRWMADVVEMATQSGVKFDEHERPNVTVVAGYDLSGNELVVFVDRFEDLAFHSEPAYRRFAWLFQDWM